MRLFRVLAGIVLILMGLGALASYAVWNDEEKLTDYEKKWTFTAEELRQLHVVSDYNTDVTFEKSSDGTNSVYLQGKGPDEMIERTKKTEISGQRLDLDLTRQTRFSAFNFSFGFRDSDQHLTIAVTDEAVLDELQLLLDSGNITVSNAASAKLREAQIKVDSGNIKIKNFKAGQLALDVDSGNVTADGIQANLTGSSNSGNVEIRNFSGNSKLEVDSGNIKLYKLDIAETDLSVDSGNVYVQMPSSFAGFYDLQVDSGKIRAPDSKRQTKDFVKVRADSGNITIEEK